MQVASYNHTTNEVEYKPIVRYDKNIGRKLLKIKAGDKEMICTEEHEVWTENRGYVKAKDLLVNDILRTS